MGWEGICSFAKHSQFVAGFSKITKNQKHKLSCTARRVDARQHSWFLTVSYFSGHFEVIVVAMRVIHRASRPQIAPTKMGEFYSAFITVFIVFLVLLQ